MADLQSDVWTLRNTRHSKADRWSQFKANCRTIEAGFDFSLSMFWSVWQAALSLPASCSPYRAMHPGWGEKLLVSLPARSPTTSQPELQLQLRTQPTLLLCEREREGRIRQPAAARSNNMGHLQSDAQHCTVGTSSKLALLSHLENDPTLTLKVPNHAFLHRS